MTSPELEQLMQAYLADTLPETEFARLWETVYLEEHAEFWESQIGALQLYPTLHQLSNAADVERAYARAKKAIMEEQTPVVHRVHFLKTTWFRYAAVLLLIAGTATFLYINNRPEKEIARATVNNEKPADIQPGGNKAILTLSDGSTIVLDSAANGNLARQGGTKIIKLKAGVLAYDGSGAPHGGVLYNTISTPKSGQFQITLQDGSKIWLNADSKLSYPTAFTGKERKVTVTGEAYFEIAPNKQKPFIVRMVNGAEIQVLGTRFVVNSYTDEPAMKATLLDGSIRLSNANHTARVIMKPGEQTVLDEYNMNTALLADPQNEIAWKNGYFAFRNADIYAVARALSRWYNVDIRFDGKMPEQRFNGKIERSLSLGQVLNGLTRTRIKYKLEKDHTITLIP